MSHPREGCWERSYLRRRSRWRRRQRRVGQSNLATGDGRRYRPLYPLSSIRVDHSLDHPSPFYYSPYHSHFAFHEWRSAIMPSTVAVYSFPQTFAYSILPFPPPRPSTPAAMVRLNVILVKNYRRNSLKKFLLLINIMVWFYMYDGFEKKKNVQSSFCKCGNENL